MAADPATLEATAQVLLDRADDLYYLGQQIVSRSSPAGWQCAKADRFHDAMTSRQVECRRLAIELRELGRHLRAQAQAAAVIPPVVPGA